MKKSMDRVRNENGMSLIEAMISMAILSVGMLGIAGMFTYSAAAFGQGKYLTLATSQAQQKLEDFKTYPLANITSFNDVQTEDGVRFRRMWNVSTVTKMQGLDLKGLDLKKVKVYVCWSTGKIPHRVIISSLTTGFANTTSY